MKKPVIVGIGGEPGVGKSTLMRRIIAKLNETYGEALIIELDLLKGMIWNEGRSNERVIVFGKYPEGEKYPGTDKLSMAVQAAAVFFLAHPGFLNAHILFEGDRLFNESFLTACTESKHRSPHFFILQAPDHVLKQRRRRRGDMMAETFLKGRKTKIANLMRYPNVNILSYTDESHTRHLANRILKLLGV